MSVCDKCGCITYTHGERECVQCGEPLKTSAERELDAARAEVERLRAAICERDEARDNAALVLAKLHEAKRQGDEDYAKMMQQRDAAVRDANEAVKQLVELRPAAEAWQAQVTRLTSMSLQSIGDCLVHAENEAAKWESVAAETQRELEACRVARNAWAIQCDMASEAQANALSDASKARAEASEAITRAESAELGCEIAYRREPTAEEGEAFKFDRGEGTLVETHVPAGNWHGHRCTCGKWVWGGGTVCQGCVDAQAVRTAVAARDASLARCAALEAAIRERDDRLEAISLAARDGEDTGISDADIYAALSGWTRWEET